MRRGLAVTLSVAATVALAACGSDGDSDGGSTASGGESFKVAYSNPVASQPGQQEIGAGFEAAADSLGWKGSQINANLSPDKQVADIATMVSQQQDGIASWTLDPGAAAGAYGQAKAAGIPVIGVNSSGEGIDTTVRWEMYTCGEDPPLGRNAQAIAEARPKAKVLVVGGPPVPSIIEAEKCFVEQAKKHGLEIVASVNNTKDSASAAQPLVADALTKHSDTDAIWAYNDQSALGASAAVTASGKKVSDGKGDGVLVFGMNGDSDAITAIKDGRLTGTWDANAVGGGWALVKALTYYLGESKSDAPPKELVVESTLMTKENVGEYVPPKERKYTMDTVPLVDAP